jgi:hypothetical protein
VYSAEDALYLLDYTGSDVPEWAVVAYRITDHIDHLTGVLSADTKRAARTPDYPNGRTLDCGCVVYWANEVMSASNGTSCARCYDRMS